MKAFAHCIPVGCVLTAAMAATRCQYKGVGQTPLRHNSLKADPLEADHPLEAEPPRGRPPLEADPLHRRALFTNKKADLVNTMLT